MYLSISYLILFTHCGQANGSPRSGQVPQRKPTGPRPISTSGNFSPDKGAVDQIKRTRYRGSPNHIDSSKEDVTF